MCEMSRTRFWFSFTSNIEVIAEAQGLMLTYSLFINRILEKMVAFQQEKTQLHLIHCFLCFSTESNQMKWIFFYMESIKICIDEKCSHCIYLAKKKKKLFQLCGSMASLINALFKSFIRMKVCPLKFSWLSASCTKYALNSIQHFGWIQTKLT